MPAARTALAAILALAALARPATAAVINADFETGTFNGWSTTGDALVVTSAVGVSPHQGTYQALLTTASQSGDSNNFSGTDAVSVASLRTFLGLPAGALSTGNEGSAIRQTFSATAGDVLSFRYKFLTTEGANNDFAFVTLTGLGTLADTTTAAAASAVVLDPVFGDPTRETAWLTYSFTIPTTGMYTLGIGVIDVGDVGDNFIPSGLLVDAGSLTPAPPPSGSGAGTAVPAPPSIVILALAVGLAGVARRGRRSANGPMP